MHQWPDAHVRRAYLASPHMHTFHITGEAPVQHNDRDIEFHDLRDELRNQVEWLLAETPYDQRFLGNPLQVTFGNRSCETIASQLLDRIDALDVVRVREDEDCEAIVTRSASPSTPGKQAEGVVTLCGSSRFKDEYLRVEEDFTMAGFIVLGMQFFMHADAVALTPQQKGWLDELHLRKIDLSDFIYVVDVGGYIGESTAREIAYAEQQGKSVLRLSRNQTPSDWRA